MRIHRQVLVAALGLGLLACKGGEEIEELEAEDLDPSLTDDSKAEAWNRANNPAYVDSTFLYSVNTLPVRGGAAQPPVPGDYWANARDSLNVKWDGASSLSPAAKYAKAFGQPGVPEEVSLANGVKASPDRKTCTTNTDCDDLDDGSICASSYDNAVKRCIPTWWGICHGWAPYSLMEPVAKKPVVRRAPDGTDVTFYPGDLEGLMTMLYTEVPTKFLSSRCNKKDPPTDASGRTIDGECRDMNPGSWHVLVTNMMGLRHQGFVLDRIFDFEVWNQPGRDYVVTNAVGDQLQEITLAEAIDLVGLAQGAATDLAKDREVKKGDRVTGSFAATAAGRYTFRTSGTGDADLYVKKGSAPTTTSADCSSESGTSREECAIELASGETVHWLVYGYADSRISAGYTAPGQGAATYTYNPAAKKFFHVEMDFRFITESSPARTSHIDSVNSYTTTLSLSYVLEADEFGKILGGEWIGDSLNKHPDFSWYPTGKSSPTVAGIRYDDVKALNDEAAGTGGGGGGSDTVVTVLENAAVATGTSTSYWRSKYGAVTVPAGIRTLSVAMTGTGDADLFVRRGSNPTISTYGCKSETASSSTETCDVVVTQPGVYYVRARSKTPGTTVTVKATLKP